MHNSAKTPQNWKYMDLTWTDKDGDQVSVQHNVGLHINIETSIAVVETDSNNR